MRVSGEKTGFAYSDEIVLPALTQAAAQAARAIASSGSDGQTKVLTCVVRDGFVPPDDPMDSLDVNGRTRLKQSFNIARKLQPGQASDCQHCG
jgi:TldD protein